jgi:hypothetical protein
MIKSTRKIKCLGNSVKPGERFLHPITLKLLINKTNDILCPTEFYNKDNNLFQSKIYDSKKDKLSSVDIQKFMTLPYLNLNLESMLSIYNINTIDNLLEWVTDMIKQDKPFIYVNRIINIWIKTNYNNLLNKNNILVDLYKKINDKYWNNNSIDKINDIIKKWFKNKNYDDFDFDLGIDILALLEKK